MFLDYQDALQSHDIVRLTIDLFGSLIRQWSAVLLAELRSEPAASRPTFLTGQDALEFQTPLNPYELARGFALSVLLLSTFCCMEYPRDFLRLLSSAAAARRVLASATPEPDHKDLEIRDVTIVDVEHGTLLSHRTVFIEDGAVTSVIGSKGAQAKLGADVLDGRGKFLIPGLWDMHTHISHTDVDFPLYIANGVLGIRNMGGVQDEVFAWQKKLKDGTLLGPLAFVSGPILDGPNGPVQPASYGVRIGNAEEGRVEVDTLKSRGADFVKVYDGLSREAYFSIAAEANKVGLPFAGHVPSEVTILEAVQAGQRSIEHGIEQRGDSTAEQELIDRRRTQDFMAEAMKTGNYTLIPEGIARDGNIWLKNFSQKRADALYRTLARRGTYLCPTLVTERWVAYGDELASKPDSRQRFIDPKVLVYWQPSMNMLTKYRTPAYIVWTKVRYAKALQQIPKQQALGVQLLAGTDLTVPYIYPGSSVHDEIRLMASAGLTNLQALQTATTHPVQFFGLQKSLGSVEAGKRAEFVLLDGNPLADLDNLDHIQAVITHGRVLRKAELEALTLRAANAVLSRTQH
jgi:imidazolonepropionase-like amidohydrolase